jgi:flagellar protein FlgJ
MNVDMNTVERAFDKVPTISATDEEKKIKEKTDQFESIIIKMLLDNAMKDEKNLFSTNDPGEKIYNSMYREKLSQEAAGSFGFSQMLFDHLTKKKAEIPSS